jgi:hypothetical protein
MRIVTGWYVCEWIPQLGHYMRTRWFATRAEAEAEVSRLQDVGEWDGMPMIEASLSTRF